MNDNRKKYSFVLVMLTCMFFAGHRSSAESETEGIREKYNIVSRRNIFSRTRKADIRLRPKDNSEKSETVIKIRNIMYVLRGISLDNDNKWLFLEDDLDGGSYRLTIGQEFEGMTVKEIRFSSAVFTVGDKEVIIGLGGNLAGREVEVEVDQIETTDETDTTGAVKTEKSDSSSGSGDESDLLKQMMERRKQELGR